MFAVATSVASSNDTKKMTTKVVTTNSAKRNYLKEFAISFLRLCEKHRVS
jgi:hypothetical protein